MAALAEKRCPLQEPSLSAERLAWLTLRLLARVAAIGPNHEGVLAAPAEGAFVAGFCFAGPCLIQRCAESACITFLSALPLWLQQVTVGIVGGSDFHKICEQLGSDGAHLSPVTLLRRVRESMRPAQLSRCREG